MSYNSLFNFSYDHIYEEKLFLEDSVFKFILSLQSYLYQEMLDFCNALNLPE